MARSSELAGVLGLSKSGHGLRNEKHRKIEESKGISPRYFS
jgi:hypothetical protein